jgi:hypothetical protein
LEREKFDQQKKDKEDWLNLVKEWKKEGKSAKEIAEFIELIYGS